MKTTKLLFISACILLVFSSCSQRIADFTILSSKNINLANGPNMVRGKNRVSGIDKVHWIIIIPTGVVDVKNALDKAIESTPGCVAILDGAVYHKSWWIPYIYGQEMYIIEGTPLIDPSLVKNEADMPVYGKIELDKNSEIISVNNLSAAEYDSLKNKVIKKTNETKFQSSEKTN